MTSNAPIHEIFRAIACNDDDSYKTAWEDLISCLTVGAVPTLQALRLCDPRKGIYIYRRSPCETWHLQVVEPFKISGAWEIARFVANTYAGKWQLI